MISTEELLLVATDLAAGSTDAHWRRSISTAYYAVFQMLLSDVGELIACGQYMKKRLPRVVDHKTLKNIAIAISPESKKDPRASLPEHLFEKGVLPEVAPELREMATLVRGLYEARQKADYDSGWVAQPKDALEKLKNAKIAVGLWSKVRETEAGRVFLTGLLLGEKLKAR
ncbi:MAG: hypothetical protein NTZ56_19850 [Acidobacteria bacterium]|nr:hypothetical protein [Acidobacteriota bacterium]